MDPLRSVCLLLIAVSLCLSFARLLETNPMGSANDRSRWCTIWALVEQGTYQIDDATRKPGWDTIDKILHDGHFYSTKPPLFPTLVAGLYWVVKATLGWNLDENLAATVNLILTLVNILPWGVALWVLSEMVRRYAPSPITVVVITLVAAWGTLLTPFLSTLNNHVPAAVCVIFALDAAMRITLDGDKRWWMYALCGFFAALSTTNELPAAAFGAAIFGLLLWRERQPTLSYFVPAAVVPIAGFFITNAIATGGIQPVYMFYGTEKYEYVHNGVPSYWMNPQGIDQSKDSPLTYLLHCTVGHHGIFSLTPVLLLTLVGWGIGLRKTAKLRDYLAMGLGLTLIVLGYFLTRTANYNYGGNSVALRWLLWLVPFWLLAMIPALESLGGKRWFRVVTALLLLPSVFSAWHPFHGPWTAPWLYSLMDRWGWIDYSNPPVQFRHPVHSWIYSLPAGQQDNDYWIELSSVDADGVTSIIRIEDRGRVLVNERDSRVVRILRRSGSGQSSEFTLTIDAEAFEAGAPIDRFVVWPQGFPGANVQRLTARFLSGLPEPAQFTAHQKAYRVASNLRPEAFECLLGAAAVIQSAPGDGWEPRRFECRIVVSDEVPFGILKYETYVFDRSGRTLHAHRRWAVHRVGKFLPRPSAPAPAAAQPVVAGEAS